MPNASNTNFDSLNHLPLRSVWVDSPHFTGKKPCNYLAPLSTVINKIHKAWQELIHKAYQGRSSIFLTCMAGNGESRRLKRDLKWPISCSSTPVLFFITFPEKRDFNALPVVKSSINYVDFSQVRWTFRFQWRGIRRVSSVSKWEWGKRDWLLRWLAST